jgi:transposase
MSQQRIDMHRLQDLVRMHREGVKCRTIARLLKMSPNTERRYRLALQAADLLEGSPEDLPALDVLQQAIDQELPVQPLPQHHSSLEAFRPAIEKMLQRGGTPTAIYDRLRLENPDFEGSLSAVKRICLRIKKAQPPRPEDVVLRVETAPGEIAQVDFGCVGKLFDPVSGRIRKAYVFVMVLGFSRLMYADLVFDQSTETWLRLHSDAFEYLGGVPRIIVPDNLKAAVVRCFFGVQEKPELNRSYREMARHYGCLIDPTPPYSPEKKGKVESGVKYVKGNFFGPRAIEELDEGRAQLRLWLDQIANARTHGTTRKVPRELFEAMESGCLLPLPAKRFEPTIWKQALVHPDSHVEFERRLYSVPFVYLGQQVFLRARANTVDIFFENVLVATHARRGPRCSTREEHLSEGRRDLRHRGHQWWQDRADTISPVVGAYIEEVFGSDRVLSQLRTVQAIVTYLEQFPVERAEAACLRASRFGNFSYQGIKTILVEGLDLEPLMPETMYVHGKIDNPRFARSLSELLTSEVQDELN